MSIKNLLKWLIDSRTTAAEAAHASMPSNDFLEVDITQNEISSAAVETVGRYTAPADGYIVATAYTKDSYSRLLILSSAKQYIFAATPARSTIGGTIPISKGYTCTIQGQSILELRVLFYVTTGAILSKIGGYKELFKQFRRARVCLKAFSDCFAKHSSRARKSGFRTRLLFKIREIFLCLGSPLQEAKKLSTWRQRMVCSSASFVQKPRIKSGSFATLTMPEHLECILASGPTNGSNAFIECRRGQGTESGLQQLCQPMTRCCLSHSTEICGGALC